MTFVQKWGGGGCDIMSSARTMRARERVLDLIGDYCAISGFSWKFGYPKTSRSSFTIQ